MNNKLPQPTSQRLAELISKHLAQPYVDKVSQSQPKDQQKPA